MLSFVVLLSNNRDFVREMEKKIFRDMGSNMMIFQNNRVWERWVVVLWVMVLSKKRDFIREIEKYGFVYVAAK